jgi:hypothetical protein
LRIHISAAQEHKIIFSYPPQQEGGNQASEDSKASLPVAISLDEDEVEQETEFMESPMASVS